MRLFSTNANAKSLPALTGRLLADLIYPRACYGCKSAGTYFCAKCYKGQGTLPHPMCPHCDVRLPEGILSSVCRKKLNLDRVFICSLYRDETINSLIKSLKYRSAHSLAKPLGDFVWWWLKKEKYLDSLKNNIDIILPIPSHIKKGKRRGFNHADKLARQLSLLSGIPSISNGLIKIKNTESQVETSSKEERIKNVKDSFEMNSAFAQNLKGKNILLIDDVITTGSTISECAKTLREGGAKEVWALAIAKD